MTELRVAPLEAVPPQALPSEPDVPLVTATEGGVRVGRALLVLFGSFFVQLALGLVIGIVAGEYYGIGAGNMPPAAVAEIERVVVLSAALLGLVAGGGFALIATFWGSGRGVARQRTLRSIGWCPASRSQVLAAGCAGVALAAVYVLMVSRLLPPDPHATWGPLATAANAGGWQRLLWAFLGVVLAPAVEEFVFRGVLWAGLSRSLPRPLSALVVCATFILSHVAEVQTYWPAWLAISILAVALLAFRVRGGSLLPAWVLHTSYNTVLVAAVYLSID